MNVPAGRRWYVVHTQPHAEAKAAHHLARQGFAPYLPRYLRKRRHARRVETVAAPLFPRYLFVALDASAQRWRAIESTIGVSHLVRNGDEPAAVADGVVEALRLRETEAGVIKLAARPPFAAGERVRLLDGAFVHCEALFEGMSDGERISVLLDLLGRKVRLVVSADLVAAA